MRLEIDDDITVKIYRRRRKPYAVKGEFMYIVKDTQTEVGYSVVLGEVTDAEGHVISDAKVNLEVTSDNPDAVAIVPDADPKSGRVSFGAPGLANVNCVAKLEDGTILASFGAQFTVTVGDPAAINGGTIQFEGLTEAPEPPTP